MVSSRVLQKAADSPHAAGFDLPNALAGQAQNLADRLQRRAAPLGHVERAALGAVLSARELLPLAIRKVMATGRVGARAQLNAAGMHPLHITATAQMSRPPCKPGETSVESLQ